jgi:hypothetical protein
VKIVHISGNKTVNTEEKWMSLKQAVRTRILKTDTDAQINLMRASNLERIC